MSARRRTRKRPPLLDPSLRSAPPELVTATIDGAARGNPGPASYGVAFEDAAGKVVAQISSRLGTATNNVAEYRALLAALAYALQKGWKALKVRTDSELLARQVQGHYKVKSLDLKPLHDEAQQLISAFDYLAVEAVPRRLTRAADKLANAALDGKRPGAAGGKTSHREEKRTIRAVYQDGVFKPLEPLEPLELTQGSEFEITLRPKS